MNKKLKRSLTLFLTTGLALLPVTVLKADDWTNYESPSGVFMVRIPEGYTAATMQFMVGDERAAHSEELSSLIDQRPYKNTMKSYIIKFDQTIGPSLTSNDVAQILAEEFNGYINYYKKMEGVVRTRITDGVAGHWGGEIMISYRDPTFGVQSIRSRVLFNETTRLQQIVIGADDQMNSYATRDFFDSLVFESGVSKVEESVREKWLTMESPTGMFTMLYPDVLAPPYYTVEPKAQWDDKNEVVSISFNDPVRNEKIFFNVYGYRFNSDLDYASVQEVLTKRHIMKQRSSAKGVRLNKGIGTGKEEDGMVKFPFMETSYSIRPLKDFPYVTSVRLRAMFSGKTMLVMETMTSNALFTSPLVENLMSFVNYQPNKLHAAQEPVAPSKPAPAPVDTTPEPEYPAVPAKEKPGENLAPLAPLENQPPPPAATEVPPAAPATP
jgi:hypothetical protein